MKAPKDKFDRWWETEGRFYDPDVEDVDWFDKRRELAAYAFRAGASVRKEPKAKKRKLPNIRRLFEAFTEYYAAMHRSGINMIAWQAAIDTLKERLETIGIAKCFDWTEEE